MNSEDWREATPAERMAEAERRIEAAMRSRAEELDLVDVELDQLPVCLGELPDLRSLSLRSHRLIGASTGGIDLTPIAQLKELEFLNLLFVGTPDLAPLAQLKNLQALCLLNGGVIDLAPLAQLHKLQRLSLVGTGVTNLAPLAQLEALQCLTLEDTGVTDLAPIARLQGLQELDLSGTGVTDLAPLAQMRALQRLDLYRCRVAIPAKLVRLFAEHSRLTHLVAKEADSVPQEVLSHSFNDNCLPRLRAYLAELNLVAEAKNEVEVCILGNSHVEKPPGEKPAEVFLSYAWGDDTPEGQTRTKAVDGIYKALAEHGFQPVRDRDQIRPGERISPFLARLTSADLVVAVISDKYLRSTYCMYEIYKLWQSCQGDSDQMVERIVPILLPEVRIASFEERAPYLEAWSDRAEKVEALIRKPNLRPGARSWEEVRLIREFAHHVDDILGFLQDVLMPRKLEAHLDDGFQAVRDALRRRIEAEAER